MTPFPGTSDHRAEIFDQIPSGIVVIDRRLRIVDQNRAFTGMFGEGKGRPCYEVLKGRSEVCETCPAIETFQDRGERVLEQTGTDMDGNPLDYLVHLTPLRGKGNEVEYVAAITTDLTPTRRLQREYQILFEKVPCYVAVINRAYRVVKANERFRETFGAPTGEHCYRLFKKRGEPCSECPVTETLRDGRSHTVRQLGMNQDGSTTHYIAFTAPMVRGEGEPTHVIHMSLDVTDVHRLEAQLSQAADMRRALVENSLDATLLLDGKERIQLVNRAAEDLWGYVRDALVGRKAPPMMIPAPLQRVISGKEDRQLLHESSVRTSKGEEVPVRAAAITLRQNGDSMGSAVVAHDLTAMKRLEREKVEAERLAAVGQTVAGLAHGIKNILTGLEGGMYVTSSGLKKNDNSRVRQGWQMLERNMGRISALAKNLLAFSRGDVPDPQWIRPHTVVLDVVELFREGAIQHGIRLEAEVDETLEPAWLDPQGLHSCLANLVSNAMDACLLSRNPSCRIKVRLAEEDGAIVIEVADTGCGMDYEVKQKAFTSFFTTKGKGGTGIGLLITRKIVQQHGGSVSLASKPGEGATFRLKFPRDRLPRPEAKENPDG